MNLMIYWILSFSVYRRWLSHGRCSERSCQSWRSPSTRQLDCRKYTLRSVCPSFLAKQHHARSMTITVRAGTSDCQNLNWQSNRYLDWRRYCRCIHWERGTAVSFLWLAGSSRQRRRHVSSSYEYQMICLPCLQGPFWNLQRNRQSPPREE